MKNSWKERMAGFDDFVNEKLMDWEVPGTAVAIVKDGEIILSQGYGKRDIDKNLPVTEDTVFAIGSSSKSFTSMAIGILADEGKLDLDSPIKKYIPWFKMYDPFAAERVSARDLLCHRTGLPRHDLMWYGAKFSRKEIVERVQYLQPNTDFRSKWYYQNHMYAAAGYLVEAITGKTWEEFVQEKIFEPLGMINSSFSVSESQKAVDYSRPYNKKSDKVLEIPFRNIDGIGPAGSINSSIRDMARWLLLHLNKGKYGGRQIISEANILQAHTPHIPYKLLPWDFKEIQTAGYGLGWFIDIYRGHKLVHHGGNIDGFSALVSFMPDENTGVIILTNMHGTFLPTVLSYDIYDRLLGYGEKDWNGFISGLIKEELAKEKKAIEMYSESLNRTRKQGTQASHLLEEYTGKFENPGYGIAAISIENQNLKINYNIFDTVLTHYHYDTFSFSWEDKQLFATFHTNKSGDIDKISIPLETEPGINDIVFTKKL